MLLAVLAALVVAAPANAATLSLTADASGLGWVGLHVRGPVGETVALTEGSEPIGTVRIPSSGTAALLYATRWRCDRLTRRFTASGGGASATAGVTTPSCANRLRVSISPRRPRAGHNLRVSVADHWGEGGFGVSVCTRPPRTCRALIVPPAGREVSARFRVRRSGRLRVEVQAPFERFHRTLRAAQRGRLRVLATGDSMIEIVDDLLARRLGRRARVRNDDHISTGISKPALLDWVKHARAIAHRVRPDVTVVFLGANDGFPIGGVDCCGAAWIDGYAGRARRMMASYARHGAGHVYWLLLPAPRSGFFRRVYPAVNAAVVRAAAAFPDDVRVVHLDRVFTPGNRFRAVIRYHGRRLRVRQPDGIHLNETGAAIAAGIVVRAMRADGLLG